MYNNQFYIIKWNVLLNQVIGQPINSIEPDKYKLNKFIEEELKFFLFNNRHG